MFLSKTSCVPGNRHLYFLMLLAILPAQAGEIATHQWNDTNSLPSRVATSGPSISPQRDKGAKDTKGERPLGRLTTPFPDGDGVLRVCRGDTLVLRALLDSGDMFPPGEPVWSLSGPDGPVSLDLPPGLEAILDFEGMPPGPYQVVARTAEGRLVGTARVQSVGLLRNRVDAVFFSRGTTYDAASQLNPSGKAAGSLLWSIESRNGPPATMDPHSGRVTFHGKPAPGQYWITVFSPEIQCTEILILFLIPPIDLDINTDDHPRRGGVPLVSRPEDIDEADEPRELEPGGYLWVNDDNDNLATMDAVIDLNDLGIYVDDDLEPIRYTVPAVLFQFGFQVRVRVSQPIVKIWQGNKQNLLPPGTYGSLEALDAEADGILYLEGLQSGTTTLAFDLLIGNRVIASDSVNATVFAVDRVEWLSNVDRAAGINTVVLTNPGPVPTGQSRDGKRVFPGRLFSTDRTIRDRVRVAAVLTPAIPAGSGWNLPVNARVYDVDHYASGIQFDPTASSIDPQGNPGFEPNDNRTGYSVGDDPLGRFGVAGDDYHIGLMLLRNASPTVVDFISISRAVRWAERIGGNGRGRVTLRIVHPTPCNNWRIAAGCAGTPLKRAIRIDDGANNGVDLEYIDNTRLTMGMGAGTATRSTQTLTVWRRLHLELDRMDRVDFQEPSDESKRSLQDEDINMGTGTATLQTDLDAEVANQWATGQAMFFRTFLIGASSFRGMGTIQSNTAGSDVSVTFGANTPLTPNRVYISDDDVASYNVVNDAFANAVPRISPNTPDIALFNNRDMLPAACILAVRGSLIRFDSTADFELHVEDLDETIADSKGIKGGDLFWVATIVESYQYLVAQSYDPPSTDSLAGLSAPYWIVGTDADAEGGCTPFVETIRDAAQALGFNFDVYHRRVTLHEVGHLLGGRHGDMGLMSEGLAGTRPGGPNFSGASLRRFMLLRDQGPGSR